MNYEKIYNDLIKYRQINILTSGYVEVHHIILRSLGGTNSKSNLVTLSGREHYIAHLLLARFMKCRQTICALASMQRKNSKMYDRPYIKSGRMYEWVRKEAGKYMSEYMKDRFKGEHNSQYGTRWICNTQLQKNCKIDKTESIPIGWILGRNKWIIPVKPDRKKPRLLSGKTAAQEQGLFNRNQLYSIENKLFIGLKSICDCYNLTHPGVIYRISSLNFPLWKKYS
jgi:hypothetical protein